MLKIACLTSWEVSRKISGKKYFLFRDRNFEEKKIRKFSSEKSPFFDKCFSKSVNFEKEKNFRVLLLAEKIPEHC